MNRVLSFCFVICAMAATANATFSIRFSVAGGGNLATNFANEAAQPTDGMNWGIVISTQDSSFQGNGTLGQYDPFTLTTIGTFLRVGGVQTDDFFVLATEVTGDSSFLLEDDLTTPGASGTIVEITQVDFGTNNVSQGDKIAIAWFPNNSANLGDFYGLFADPVFLVPADGATIAYDGPFEGVDPIRAANLTIVPEASTASLFITGLLLPVLRRRRCHV